MGEFRKRKIPYGELPQCVECGECFDNWDRILKGTILK